MLNLNDPFDEALEDSDERFVGANAGYRQKRWEERVVKRLVQAHVGATDAALVIREMKGEVSERTDSSTLTFDQFISFYPSFPVWLVCQPIPYAHQHVGLAELNAKKEHWFRKLFNKAEIHLPEYWHGSFGLVFEMVNMNSQFNLLHNYDCKSSDAGDIPGVRITFPFRLGSGGPICLEPLDLFLSAVAWLQPQ